MNGRTELYVDDVGKYHVEVYDDTGYMFSGFSSTSEWAIMYAFGAVVRLRREENDE